MTDDWLLIIDWTKTKTKKKIGLYGCPQVDYDDDNRNNIGQLCPQADGVGVNANVH